MNSKKILFVTQEINPYVPESKFTAMGRNIPLKAIDKGYEIRAFMPKWGNINERRNQLHEVIRLSGMNIVVDDVDHPLIIKVASVTGTRMQVYFIDNEDFFAKRLQECNEKGEEYTDNLERSVFYARGVLETVKKLRWSPELIYCQGWVASMLPLLVKTVYADEPCFRNTKVIYSVNENNLTLAAKGNMADILNLQEQSGALPKEYAQGMTPEQMDKLAIEFCDAAVFSAEQPNQALYDYALEKGIPVLHDTEVDTEKHIELISQITANCEVQE